MDEIKQFCTIFTVFMIDTGSSATYTMYYITSEYKYAVVDEAKPSMLIAAKLESILRKSILNSENLFLDDRCPFI